MVGQAYAVVCKQAAGANQAPARPPEQQALAGSHRGCCCLHRAPFAYAAQFGQPSLAAQGNALQLARLQGLPTPWQGALRCICWRVSGGAAAEASLVGELPAWNNSRTSALCTLQRKECSRVLKVQSAVA